MVEESRGWSLERRARLRLTVQEQIAEGREVFKQEHGWSNTVRDEELMRRWRV